MSNLLFKITAVGFACFLVVNSVVCSLEWFVELPNIIKTIIQIVAIILVVIIMIKTFYISKNADIIFLNKLLENIQIITFFVIILAVLFASIKAGLIYPKDTDNIYGLLYIDIFGLGVAELMLELAKRKNK